MNLEVLPLMLLEKETLEVPLSKLIDKWENTSLPLPVYDDDDRTKQLGEVISLVLEENNGVHVLKGHFINYNQMNTS